MGPDVQIFINEYSLQEQFFDDAEFESAVVTLTLLVSRVRERKIRSSLYKSVLFANYKAFREEYFQSSLKRISQRDIRENFERMIFDRHNPINWQTEQKHSAEEIFTFNEDIVTETSMAELAERKLLNKKLNGVLLNFINSPLPNGEPALVLKNEEQEVFLDSFDETEAFEQWLGKISPSASTEYSIDSTEPPKDKQTVLRDVSRFTRRNACCQGRRIYQEWTTGRFWYVDNEHTGGSVHLEVYDKRGNHIGKGSLEGDLIPDTRVKGRDIKDLI